MFIGTLSFFVWLFYFLTNYLNWDLINCSAKANHCRISPCLRELCYFSSCPSDKPDFWPGEWKVKREERQEKKLQMQHLHFIFISFIHVCIFSSSLLLVPFVLDARACFPLWPLEQDSARRTCRSVYWATLTRLLPENISEMFQTNTAPRSVHWYIDSVGLLSAEECAALHNSHVCGPYFHFVGHFHLSNMAINPLGVTLFTPFFLWS